MNIDKIEAAGLILSILAVIAFYTLITQSGFPAFKYAVSDKRLVEISRSIGREVSLFMWNYRSIDLIVQAFVLFAAAAACLAVLRREKTEERVKSP